MNQSKNWIVFIIVLIIFLILCLVLDALFAGILWAVLFMFQVPIALDICKWVFVVIFGLQFALALPLLCHTLDKEENEVGT